MRIKKTDFGRMNISKSLEIIAKYLDNVSTSDDERNELYLFISTNIDQFLEISERMVSEVKRIKDRHPNSWKEMVAMTMFSTL